ncbi:MAG: GNAT family N-acetyltransferase [Alphaproteobacteria bacterium]|nr:GNAT family N-acetyltransferase [Alphaproteobacteria bacterium]
MQLEKLAIRPATSRDLKLLQDIANAMHSAKDIGYFEKSLHLQSEGSRLILIAEYDGAPAGYTMLAWQPKYAFFKAMGFPEIQDLNVLPALRRKGIARAIIAHCEALARKKKLTHMGIGVGMDASYGAAQRLYVKLGYIPDGYGITYDRKTVTFGELKPIDDHLSLMMVKEL